VTNKYDVIIIIICIIDEKDSSSRWVQIGLDFVQLRLNRKGTLSSGLGSLRCWRF